MVDPLKPPGQGLEPPECAACHIEMTWLRSMLVSTPPARVAQFFQCPNCNCVKENELNLEIIGQAGDPAQPFTTR